MDRIPTGIPRRRLALVALIELALVVAFAIAVWQVWQSRQATASPASPNASQAVPASTPPPVATPIGLPQDGTTTPAPASPGSGGETASTLLQHLQQFNGLVSSVEEAETTVLQILIPGSVWYLQHVVVPRVEAALHAG
ncbi:MAG: hypothetical protein J2P43_16040 [Candidatus Dormibacteraeota bacterium]|nr:hypothetical protein [Candidatus Dormibacteraeota bacterium]MBO0746530.1 hypothetical protein [Candidatus Dormibacteraeota bacterium]